MNQVDRAEGWLKKIGFAEALERLFLRRVKHSAEHGGREDEGKLVLVRFFMVDKFLSAEEMAKSYENLEKEFTKKCQELARVKKRDGRKGIE